MDSWDLSSVRVILRIMSSRMVSCAVFSSASVLKKPTKISITINFFLSQGSISMTHPCNCFLLNIVFNSRLFPIRKLPRRFCFFRSVEIGLVLIWSDLLSLRFLSNSIYAFWTKTFDLVLPSFLMVRKSLSLLSDEPSRSHDLLLRVHLFFLLNGIKCRFRVSGFHFNQV